MPSSLRASEPASRIVHTNAAPRTLRETGSSELVDIACEEDSRLSTQRRGPVQPATSWWRCHGCLSHRDCNPYLTCQQPEKINFRDLPYFCTVQRHTYIRLPLWCAAGIDLEPTRIQKYHCTRRQLLVRPRTVILGDEPFMKGAKSACGGSMQHAQRCPFLNRATMDSEPLGSLEKRDHARFVQTGVLAVTVSALCSVPRL